MVQLRSLTAPATVHTLPRVEFSEIVSNVSRSQKKLNDKQIMASLLMKRYRE